MGPDCGTAIINNVPLAFANVVPKGKIGMVCASGTGTQEVSSIIAQLGCGVSQVIGTGGRDLKKEIGGLMMKLGLDALINDPNTEVITLVSKPPAKEIASEILDIAKNAGKPVVVCFIVATARRSRPKAWSPPFRWRMPRTRRSPCLRRAGEGLCEFTMGEEKAETLAKEIAGKMAPTQKYVRGFYTGGTLCDEAMKLMIGNSATSTATSRCTRRISWRTRATARAASTRSSTLATTSSPSAVRTR